MNRVEEMSYTNDKRTPSKNDNNDHGAEEILDIETKCDVDQKKKVNEVSIDQSEHEKQKETNQKTENQIEYDREENTTQKDQNDHDKTC